MEAILVRKQFYRMITSGFIHADWQHFAFNAFSFFSFARAIEVNYGAGALLLIYLSAIIGGSILSLIIHRRHEYLALGASGGVCGVIFASIFLLPGSSVTLFPLPFGVPAYLYAGIFLVGSFIAHRRQKDNIGHDAHLGGAIVGLLASAALYPKLILAAPGMFAAVLGLSLAIMFVLIRDPLHLLNFQFERRVEPEVRDRAWRYQENRKRNEKMAELDMLLEQVSRGGMESLSSSQRKKLEQLSNEIYGRDRTTKPVSTSSQSGAS